MATTPGQLLPSLPDRHLGASDDSLGMRGGWLVNPLRVEEGFEHANTAYELVGRGGLLGCQLWPMSSSAEGAG
jgi:hypothetical protein